MVWTLFAWLLPTLLLLPFQPEEAPLQPAGGARRAQRGSRLVALCGSAEAATEAWLRQLLPQPVAAADAAGGADGWGGWAPHSNYRWALSWLVTLSWLWLLCCLVAPLYGDGGTGS